MTKDEIRDLVEGHIKSMVDKGLITGIEFTIEEIQDSDDPSKMMIRIKIPDDYLRRIDPSARAELLQLLGAPGYVVPEPTLWSRIRSWFRR